MSREHHIIQVSRSTLGQPVMKQIYGLSSHFTLFLLLFANVEVYLVSLDIDDAETDRSVECAFLHCEKGDRCINRKFWCKNPPCPSMLYCSKSEKESKKGPVNCDSVRCSKGYVCIVRTHHCRWDEGKHKYCLYNNVCIKQKTTNIASYH